MPPSNLLTIYSLFHTVLTTSSCRAHCASAVANPVRSDIFLRIPRHGIRSKKEIKHFVQGAGVIRSERWLAECVVACRKSGLFTVRFSGKYLPLDATTVRTLAFIFLCFRRPVGAKPTWTPWPRWRLDRQPPEVLPANTLCNLLAVVARPRHSNSILSLMQSSLTRHTIGPRIVSSEEDNYPLDAPSPRPLFDDGSDQEVHVVLKMFLGDSVRKTVAAQQAVKDSKSEEDGNEDGNFMSWKDIEVMMLPDHAGPSGSQDVSECPVGGTLPTTSALLPLASSAPASPAPASSVPASSAPASSICTSAVQAPAASSLNTTDIEEETELDS
ncbi:hypothetical protein C8Q72DRAFT_798098 [Fomitopsis betulina]|nr:hypothetical protein C8Q72DRAFT_798098 [Fomitopsis betulina]